MSRLYRSRIPTLTLVAMLAVGLLALLVAFASTGAGTVALQLVGARWDDVVSFVVGLYT